MEHTTIVGFLLVEQPALVAEAGEEIVALFALGGAGCDEMLLELADFGLPALLTPRGEIQARRIKCRGLNSRPSMEV